jgi:hypothetical protein
VTSTSPAVSNGAAMAPSNAWRIARATALPSAANRGLPVADADDASRSRDAPDLVVGQVAQVVARPLDAGVRDDHGPARECERLDDRPRRSVGEVEDDPALFHATDDRATLLREPSLRDAMGGSGEIGVDEVG